MNSASQSQQHQAVPLLTLNGNSDYEFHKEHLENVIQQNGVGDLPVVIVSITGKLREGKSFFLNYCLRYLRSSNKENWIGSQNQPLEGFEWTRSCEGITKGILIWSEIFKVSDSDGKQIGIMLMDTQGTFDQNSTQKDNLTIFGLSMLISSFQIFNIKDQIDESSLQHLAHFTEYARLATAKNSNENPFPPLLFLMRDWSYANEFPYGESGGLDYMNSKLGVTSNLNDDARKVRESIKKAFNNLSCFLMPHPGLDALEKSNFRGRIGELRGNFVENIKYLIPSILGTGKLRAKQIKGRPVTGSAVVHHLNSYVKTYSSKKLPKVTMSFEQTIKTTCDNVMDGIIKEYKRKMEEKICQNQRGMEERQLQTFHGERKKVVLNKFDTKIIDPECEVVKEKRSELERKLENLFNTYSVVNKQNKKRQEDVNNTVLASAIITGAVTILGLLLGSRGNRR